MVLHLKHIPPYTPDDWTKELTADQPGVRLPCPNCGHSEWYHPIPSPAGTQRKYRACKVCGFWQEADGTPAYRCWMTVHTCLGTIPANMQCEYCGAWGAVNWHPGCWRILPAKELGVTKCKNCGVVLTRSHIIPWPVRADGKEPALLRRVARVVGGVAILSLATVLAALVNVWRPSNGWLMVSVFAATATVPHWLVDGFARVAVALGEHLQPRDHAPSFENPGAFLGVVERALFLGALVAHQPGFIGIWLVLKGIAGWRRGGTDIRAGRLFQVYLLNNAVSLAGVGLGWLAWKLLCL